MLSMASLAFSARSVAVRSFCLALAGVPAGAARAGAIVDDKGVAEILAELGAKTPRDVVLRAARSEWTNDAHGARGPVIILRLCELGRCNRQDPQGEYPSPHGAFLTSI